MSGHIVLGGRVIAVPDPLRVISPIDDPVHVQWATKVSPRTEPLQFLVAHSLGERTVQEVTPGSGTVTDPWFVAHYVNSNSRNISYDAAIRVDGTVFWLNDPLRHITWEANQLNPRGIGIEMQQGTNGAIYQPQIDAFVGMANLLTEEIGWQRQIPWHQGKPDRRVLTRFLSRANGGVSGDDYFGVVGHRNGDDNRGDPGDGVMWALKRAGYEGFDLQAEEDKRVWRARQTALGIRATGVPGPETVAALKAKGYRGGLWVQPPRAWVPWAVFGASVVAGAAAHYAWERRAA